MDGWILNIPTVFNIQYPKPVWYSAVSTGALNCLVLVEWRSSVLHKNAAGLKWYFMEYYIHETQEEGWVDDWEKLHIFQADRRHLNNDRVFGGVTGNCGLRGEGFARLAIFNVELLSIRWSDRGLYWSSAAYVLYCSIQYFLTYSLYTLGPCGVLLEKDCNEKTSWVNEINPFFQAH